MKLYLSYWGKPPNNSLYSLGQMASLTYWVWMTHKCVSKLTMIGSDNGLSPGRRQVIIWANVWISLNRPMGTNFSEIMIEICKFPFKNMNWNLSSGNWRPFCLGLNVLIPVIEYAVFRPAWFVTYPVPSHYLHLYRLIVDPKEANSSRIWIKNRLFTRERCIIQLIVCKMFAICSRLKCVWSISMYT